MNNQKNTNSLFGAIDTMRINHQLSNLCHGKELRAELIRLGKAGRSEEESAALADRIMKEVLVYENVRETVEENTSGAVNELFAMMDTMEQKDRVLALDKILFGLECVSDDEAFARAVNAADAEALYRERHGEGPECSDETEDILKRKLLLKVENMNLSPKALQRLAGRFGNGEGWVATAAAFGREGYALKCLAAMDLIQRGGKEADVSEAVLTACVDVDMQAVADAVSRGQMVEKVALTVLKVATIAGLIILYCNFIHDIFSIKKTVALPSGEIVNVVATPARAKSNFIGFFIAMGLYDDVLRMLDPLLQKGAALVGDSWVFLQKLVSMDRTSLRDGLNRLAESAIAKAAKPFVLVEALAQNRETAQEEWTDVTDFEKAQN